MLNKNRNMDNIKIKKGDTVKSKYTNLEVLVTGLTSDRLEGIITVGDYVCKKGTSSSFPKENFTVLKELDEPIKVGDPVTCAYMGWGKVETVRSCSELYPIIVKFETGSLTYTTDLKLYDLATHSLKRGHVKTFKQRIAPKKKKVDQLKVGDEVTCLLYGHGVVESVETTCWPVSVRFTSGKEDYYTKDGRLNDCTRVTLFKGHLN